MRKLLKNIKEENGFTLVEMAIVLLVIAALLLIFIPNVGSVGESVDETTGEAIVTTVESQAMLYKLDNDNQTATLKLLVDEKYITKEQREAYEASDSDTKSPIESGGE